MQGVMVDHGAADRARRTETGNRFLAFTFAASEMVVEADNAGTITYAAGAFRSRLGAPPEAFLGRPLTELVAPSERDALTTAIYLLNERGRLLPCIVRLANKERGEAVLAGLKLMPDRPDSAICLTLGLPPLRTSGSQTTTVQQLAQTLKARLDGSAPGHLAFLEVHGGVEGSERLSTVLETVSPDLMASEIAPGRYGVLGESAAELNGLLPMLEAACRGPGQPGSILMHQVSLDCPDLSPSQAARALRLALAVFARDGTAGLDRAGLSDGLATYVQHAMVQAGSVRKAIVQRMFSILYQPIVHLDGRQVHHYEALIRPSHGMADHSPQEFVTLVETVGLADELDMAVAAMVCQATDASAASVAVNLSGQSVQNPVFRDRLMEMLHASRAVGEGRLLVEMTETAQVDRVTEAAETARQLRALGVRFCMDDFGAGAADIRLLRAIPTDIVKLDGSFIPGMVKGGRERAFVAGMVEIARAAGAEVVAERVETEAEAEALNGVGATFGQGWLFGRPAALPVRPLVRSGKRQNKINESWS